ncbi:MAG: DHH family phosphoesterase [Planctomycetes bacterium]|nr:DHH family phosphoesterase [Planctomycetota bacterium]
MHILIAGYGVKISEFAEMLKPSTGKIYVVSEQDMSSIAGAKNITVIKVPPHEFTFAKNRVNLNPSRDVIIVTDFKEERLHKTVKSLSQMFPPERIIVVTNTESEDVLKKFPDVIVGTHYSIYRNQFKRFFKSVEVRSKLTKLRDLVTNKEKVLIIICGNPDPDALGSAFGLSFLIKGFAKKTEIAYTGEFTRHQNLAMVQLLEIPVIKYSDSMASGDTFVIVVDSQPDFFDKSINIKFNACIDHHPKKKRFNLDFEDIGRRYGATSTMITEYFVFSNADIPDNIGGGLFYGIKTDTSNLTKNTYENDIRMYQVLRRVANLEHINVIELSEMPFDSLEVMKTAITNLYRKGEILFSYLGEIQNPHFCVYIADYLVRVADISCVVVCALSTDKLTCIFRSDGMKKNVGMMCNKLFSKYGLAGGHKTMARAEIPVSMLHKLSITSDEISSWLKDMIFPRRKS